MWRNFKAKTRVGKNRSPLSMKVFSKKKMTIPKVVIRKEETNGNHCRTCQETDGKDRRWPHGLQGGIEACGRRHGEGRRVPERKGARKAAEAHGESGV